MAANMRQEAVSAFLLGLCTGMFIGALFACRSGEESWDQFGRRMNDSLDDEQRGDDFLLTAQIKLLAN